MPLSPEAIARFKAFMAEPNPTPSNDTKTKRDRKREYEERAGYTTPTADLAAKIEAAERIIWIPCSYVLFARQATCRACGATERCLDVPRLFLQQRKQRKDDSNPYLYTPVKEVEWPSLPRRVILSPATTPYCLSCIETDKWPSKTLSLKQEDIGSRIESAEIYQINPKEPSPLVALASPPSAICDSLWNTPPAVSAGSPSETAFGSACGEREFGEQIATAEG